MPRELRLLHAVDRYGVEAVFGRKQLYAGEMRRMNYAENLVNIFNSRKAAMNVVVWTQSNPAQALFLEDADRVANEY